MCNVCKIYIHVCTIIQTRLYQSTSSYLSLNNLKEHQYQWSHHCGEISRWGILATRALWHLDHVDPGWWLSHPSEKYESQSGWFSPRYGNITNVSNHRLVMILMRKCVSPMLIYVGEINITLIKLEHKYGTPAIDLSTGHHPAPLNGLRPAKVS